MNLLINYSIFMIIYLNSAEDLTDSVLEFPYKFHSLHQRSLEGCSRFPYGNETSVQYLAHNGQSNFSQSFNRQKNKVTGNTMLTLPIIEMYQTTQPVSDRLSKRDVLLHVAYINNPQQTVSVYEPLRDGTCDTGKYQRATVLQSAQNRHCLMAFNAGLFNTTSGKCYGNIVSDGRLVQDSEGIQNAHFGITRDGHLFFGYLSEIDVIAKDFLQLVGGVIWVLKDGVEYIEQSIKSECQGTEETGTLQRFASVVSARTIIAHDNRGRLMVVQFEGKTERNGASLYEAADILKKLGAINAINLDGGGSSTLVINNTLVNYPSDFCEQHSMFQCMRSVSTIICVHEPHCNSVNCSGHGTCDNGVCGCHKYWSGEGCDQLKCPSDCSGHGVCTESGCICWPGYSGNECSVPCSDVRYGYQCLQQCQCQNQAFCDPASGQCTCNAGFSGTLCQYRCNLGFYGMNCSSQCACDDICLCDPVSGFCNYTYYTQMDHVQGVACFSQNLQQQRSPEVKFFEEFKSAILSMIILVVISIASLILNFVLLYKRASSDWCRKHCCKMKAVKYKQAQNSRNGNVFLFQGVHGSGFDTSSSNEEMGTLFTQIND